MSNIDFKDLPNLLIRHQRMLADFAARIYPIKAGEIAVRHFKQNFVQQGFVDGGLHEWDNVKRRENATKKSSQRQKDPILMQSRHLMNSTKAHPGNAEVIIKNEVPYAIVHNGGLKAGRGAGFTMPKRQFIGESKELTGKIENMIETEIENIFEY